MQVRFTGIRLQNQKNINTLKFYTGDRMCLSFTYKLDPVVSQENRQTENEAGQEYDPVLQLTFSISDDTGLVYFSNTKQVGNPGSSEEEYEIDCQIKGKPHPSSGIGELEGYRHCRGDKNTCQHSFLFPVHLFHIADSGLRVRYGQIILKSGSILRAVLLTSSSTDSGSEPASNPIFIFWVMNDTVTSSTPFTFFTASSMRLAQLAQSTSILNDLFIPFILSNPHFIILLQPAGPALFPDAKV